jgi:hypothetical protein
MASEEDLRETSQLLTDLRQRVGLVAHEPLALEPPEQRRVCLSRDLLELLKNPTFHLFYPADRFPELHEGLLQIGHKLSVQYFAELDSKLAQIESSLTFGSISEGNKWAITLAWFIPRKYRNEIMGDILEDCVEMREAGCTETRIKFHVVYQWLIAVIALVPTAVKTSIVDAVKQVISPPK